MTTSAPVRCSLADIADHQFVTVDAWVGDIDLKHLDTSRPWATVTLMDAATTADARVLVDVNVYSTTFALCSEHLRIGNRITVSAEVALDADGLFMSAHTIHPTGVTR